MTQPELFTQRQSGAHTVWEPVSQPKPSQAAKILAYLRRGNTLTDLGDDGKPGALGMFGCRRLGARIYDINRNVGGVNPSGLIVYTESIKAPGGAWVARYSV